MQFFNNLDFDIKSALKAQLRDLWTHTSTALEGNTLTLGETKFVIEEGLTVSGKPLKDHQEVIGHSRAIDLVYDLIKKDKINDTDLFDLHKAVMSQVVVDVYKPIGGWKREPNGTYFFNEETQEQDFFEYASPVDTPALMNDWLNEFNQKLSANHDREGALKAYSELHAAFVNIHPFWDGNGRVARLVSNIPVLKSGHPPILIQNESRKDYISHLVNFQLETGAPQKGKAITAEYASLKAFSEFCSGCWQNSLEIVDNAHNRQAERDKTSGISKIAANVSDPAIRKELTNKLRPVNNLERIKSLLEEEARKAGNQRDAKEKINDIILKIHEAESQTRDFIQNSQIPQKEKNAVLKILDKGHTPGVSP